MKLLFENFRKYVNEGQEEDLNTQVALKIARGGLQDTALGMSDDDLKDLVVYIYDEEFDETGEGWNPYDEDLAQIRDVLTPDDQEDREEYGIEEMIREEIRMVIEKRKKRKKRKTKKKKGNKICPAGIAWAKRTFDTYPSAYANLAASKYCKDPNYAKGSKRKKK